MPRCGRFQRKISPSGQISESAGAPRPVNDFYDVPPARERSANEDFGASPITSPEAALARIAEPRDGTAT
jgi:hypothetical protein